MENKFTDKSTVDQAWSTMRSTLDKEMPVQRKRRAIWWIPVGFGLLALMSLGYVLSSGDTETNMNTKIKPHEQIERDVEPGPIASTEVNSPSTIINQTEIINKEETKSIENIELESTFTQRPSKKNKAITKTSAPLKSTVSSPKSTKQLLRPSNQMKTTIATEVSEKKDAEVVIRDRSLMALNPNSSAADTIENASLAEEWAPVARPALHPADQLPILNNQQFDLETELNVQVPLRKIRKWRLGLKTVVLSDVKIDSPTLLVEGQVRRRMGSRWSFISGLGLKSQNLKFSVANLSVPRESLILDQDVNGIGDLAFPDFGLENSFNSSKQTIAYSFNFLYIPVGISYNFKSRWSLDAGIHYNFLELSDSSSNSDALRWGTQTIPSNENSFASSIKNFRSRNFNHFSYYLSMNYKLGKKASLLLQYQGNTQRFGANLPKVDTHQFGIGMNWLF